MTSQVALLNRIGVAIASDSIATLTSRDGSKPLYNAKKVFEIGPNHKVLVLNNGNSSISGVPVETLLAKWASGLTEAKAKTSDYWESFLDFLEALEKDSIPEMEESFNEFVTQQLQYISECVSSRYEGLKPWLDEVKSRFAEDELLLDGYRNRVSLEVGKWSKHIFGLREMQLVDEDRNQADALIHATQAGQLSDLIDLWFPAEICTKTTKAKLLKTLASSICRYPIDIESNRTCELAFVGYGSDEIFPTVYSLGIETVFFGIARWTGVKKSTAAETKTGIVYLMAQTKTIEGFLDGFHATFLADLKERIPDVMLENQKFTSPVPLGKKKQDMWKGIGASVFNRLVENIRRYKQIHRLEFESTIGLMGITELSKVAKSLIDIEILGTLNQASTATVGGAVAVARITLADGVVWETKI